VADGTGDYQDVLDSLPLILVTSRWVRSVYARDGLTGKNIEILPVGCDTDCFLPRDRSDPKVAAVREALGIGPDEIMILTVGGDATSKGAQEVMQALALIDGKVPDWKYVCKVWPQARTSHQNALDLELAAQLGIDKNVIYATNITSRDFMPYLLAACDIYAAPSRLEGFGMLQVEANACGKPVIGINAMGLLTHGTRRPPSGRYAQEIRQRKRSRPNATAGPDGGWSSKAPRIVDYRQRGRYRHLMSLMQNAELRQKMGEAGRKRAVENYHYRAVAGQFAKTVAEKLGIS
jgi:glycosyltransferase involved in cell wall biosynthesis